MYYVLSAGTNLGDRLANLTYCREALDLVPGTHVVSASAVYQTQPVGYARQDDFLQCVLFGRVPAKPE